MFKDIDSAAGQLYAWEEYRAAWIYRATPTSITPRNYPLPEPPRPVEGDMPLPGSSAVPEIVQKIDPGGNGLVTNMCGGGGPDPTISTHPLLGGGAKQVVRWEFG